MRDVTWLQSPSVGFSLVRSTLDPEADPEAFRTWRASTHRLGSPGADDPEPVAPPIYVNEVLTRSGGALKDTVELHNPNPTNVDLGGWWLSDARNFPYRYRIPSGMIIPSMGFLVLDESHFNTSEDGLSFDADGERCYLFSGDADGNLTGYSHGFFFHGSDRNVAFGRNRSSTGADNPLNESISRVTGTTLSIGGPVPAEVLRGGTIAAISRRGCGRDRTVSPLPVLPPDCRASCPTIIGRKPRWRPIGPRSVVRKRSDSTTTLPLRPQ